MNQNHPLAITMTVLCGCLIAALFGAYRKIDRLEQAADICQTAALTCPAIEGKRIADIEINRPDGSITCSYYRPHGAHITRATVWPANNLPKEHP